MNQQTPRFPIFHVPHDGCNFPDELLCSVCIPMEAFMAFHEKMRDVDVRKMVPKPYSAQCFEVSRLLCDVERFIGPTEIMEQYGMGFCYERAYDGTKIKHITEELLAATRRYYDRHHRQMMLLCEEHPRVLFFDLHSYSDEIIPPYALRSGMATPDLCIGTDAHFTPPALTKIVRHCFSKAGFTTAENFPYEGLYVPENILFGQCPCDFAGIMLELNRRSYCDAAGHPQPERIAIIQETNLNILIESKKLNI